MSMLGSDDLKKKVFTGVTCAINTLELTHNLGVIPKFIVVEDDNHYSDIEDYGLGEVYYGVLAPVETITLQNQCNGALVCRNLASGNRSSVVAIQANPATINSQYTVTTTSLLVKPLLGNSNWTVAPSYTVTFYY